MKKSFKKIYDMVNPHLIRKRLKTTKLFGAYELKNYAKMSGILSKVLSIEEYEKLKLDDFSILQHAIMEENLEAIKALSELKLFPTMLEESNNSHKWTPILRAAATGNIGILKYLHQKGSSFLHQTDEGTSILHICASENSVRGMSYILDKKPDINVNVQDAEGWAPAHLAAFLGHFDLMNLLLENGADLLLEHKYQMNCIHEAIRVDNIEMLRILYPMIGERGNERDLSRAESFGYLHLAAGSDEGTQCLEYFLKELMLSPNEICNLNDKSTPLHFAILHGNLPHLRILLNYGANPNFKDKLGNTAYHLGLLKQNLSGVKVLESYGGMADIPNNDGLTAIDLAVSENIREIKLYLKSLSKYSKYDFYNLH